MKILAPLLICTLSLPLHSRGEDKDAGEFERLRDLDWQEVFHDPCTGDWHQRWALDGLKATVSNSGN